jgi:hypothetical protein
MKNKLQAKFLLVNSTIGNIKFFNPTNNNFKNSLALFFMVMGMGLSWGQISINSINTAFTQNFDLIGTSATATLPLGFKIGSDWSTGTTATTVAAGTSGTGALTSTSSGGIYNFANGITATSTDRSIGFLTSGSFTSPNSISLKITNNSGVTIINLLIAFDYEKYRAGIRVWDMNFFHGSTSTSDNAANLGDQNYSANAANAVVNPTTTISKSVLLSGISILNGASYYLRWTSSGAGGNTNSQGIGIDNFSVIGNPTNNWIGGTGNWSTTTNWSLGAIPQNTDNIAISSGNPSMDVDYTLNTGRTLTISGTGGLTINSGKTITISGAADFGGKPVTIKSDSNGSGAVGPILGTLIGATNVTVERFIPSKRAWRALTSPVIGTTNNSVYYNWQNNGAVANGVGLELWGSTGTGNIGNGLSLGASNSILQYNNSGTTGAWNSLSNTKTTNLFDGNINNAFMVFVTGPYATTSTNISGGSADTIVKATGQLIIGSKTYANLPSGVHTLIGNPYASPISPLLLLNGNTSFGDNLWIWDAKATNNNSVGAFNSFDRIANRYTNITNSTLTPTTPDIQSGQAFFIKANSGTATLTITEGFKLGATSANTIFKTGTNPEIVRVGLYKQENNEWTGRDGAMEVLFSDAEVNQATNKMTNGSENIAFSKNGVLFASEHHLPLFDNDVLNIKVWNLMVGTNYKLKINTEDYFATNLQATLEDLYTNTRTSISLDGSAVEYSFTVTTDALSTGDRFRIVFQREVLGINNQLGKSFSIFPNPITSDFFQVNLGRLLTGTYTYSIYNSYGQELEKGSFENISQSTNYTILINTIASGIYFMKIKGSDNSVFTSKIIKN